MGATNYLLTGMILQVWDSSQGFTSWFTGVHQVETTGEVDERKMEDTPVKALRGNGPAVFVMGISGYTPED